MSEWYQQAAEKLERERKSGKYDRHAAAMKDAVREALDGFCRQNEEFAQAVVQGGSFEDCMKAVARSAGNCLSDLEAYKRAVSFYFPGADVRFHMTVQLEPEAPQETAPAAGPVEREKRSVILNLEDFL